MITPNGGRWENTQPDFTAPDTLPSLFTGQKRKVAPSESTGQNVKRYRKASPGKGNDSSATGEDSSSELKLPPTSEMFDDVKKSNVVGDLDDKAQDDNETEIEDLKDRSMPIFLGSGRYFVPRDPLEIQSDYARDGFGLAPLGTCVYDSKHLGDSALGHTARGVDNAVEAVGGGNGGGDEGGEDVVEVELPRAFVMVPPEDVPSVKWRRTWGLMASKLVPKELRRIQAIKASREGQKKRLVQTLTKELRKRASRNFRGLRDVNMRAKRLVRDMQMYWRKYEKEVAENRKRADKMETERRKTDTERQERERQQKKLEFLLTQTELFSHFIGKKMGILPRDAKVNGAAVAAKVAGVSGGVKMEDGEEKFTETQRLKILEKKEEDENMRKEALEKTTALINEHYKKTAEFDRDFHATIGGVLGEKPLPEDMDLLNPSTMPQDAMQVAEPTIFNGQLKSYQKKGLNWLANLYEQGINGILADEMGLGKTIQSIAFMAHLCEAKGIWGPFLVIAPNSTLHQWQQEISKFCPALSVLPYWGSQKERKIIRKFWKPELLYKKDAAFHLLITSYHVVVADEKHFGRLKWHYMLLDEAQHIKNSSSLRWKSLLNLKCRNRLLLTGTPIQNSMAELWALLHFIMPDFFDSHEEFNEWFSKDIQGHAQGDKKTLDAHQLQRLHMILKPFMLRREKKDVEHEMAPKIEVQVNCPLSVRQRKLYNALKNKINMKDLLTNTENLMNIVMQFRKVCNHPEIFERRSVEQPFFFLNSQSFLHKYDLQRLVIQPEAYKLGSNPLSFAYPKLLDMGLRYSCHNGWEPRHRLAVGVFSIFHAHYVYTSSLQGGQSCFSFTRFIDLTPAETTFIATTNPMFKWLVTIAQEARLSCLQSTSTILPTLSSATSERLRGLSRSLETRSLFNISLRRNLFSLREKQFVPMGETGKEAEDEIERVEIPPLVRSHSDRLHQIVPTIRQALCYCSRAAAPPPVPLVIGRSHWNWYRRVFHNEVIKEVLVGGPAESANPTYIPHSFGVSVQREGQPSLSRRICARPGKFLSDLTLGKISRPVLEVLGSNTANLRIPNFGKLLSDSGKLCTLDLLLRRLRTEGHRVLIFSQMTKMIDILEDYMRFRKIKFFRLDGQTSLADRRDMVREFQQNPEYFVFLLSTRAGGLGINLTAADTVIFYDNDWNPTMDAQAMDRVHRIGQTKQVTVYRLVCKNTVEERILKRAQVKHTIQKTVYAGGFKMQGATEEISLIFKADELRELVLGDEVKDQIMEEKRKKEAKQRQIEEDRRVKRETQKAEKRKLREEKERVRHQKQLEKQREKDRKAKERALRKEQKEKERAEKQQRKIARQLKKQEKNSTMLTTIPGGPGWTAQAMPQLQQNTAYVPGQLPMAMDSGVSMIPVNYVGAPVQLEAVAALSGTVQTTGEAMDVEGNAAPETDTSGSMVIDSAK
ncbi:hypothetical protein AAMO2058_000667500 [Amorphochlora amoebiformis]